MTGRNSAFELLQILFLFAFIVGLAYVTARFFGRRWALASPGRSLRLLDQLAVGPQHTVCVVEVAGRMLVVGCGPQQVSLLQELDAAAAAELRAALDASRSGAGQAVLGAPFGAVLERLLRRDTGAARGPMQEGAPTEGNSVVPGAGGNPAAEQLVQGIRRLRQLRRGRAGEGEEP